jgi:hypothetical protein
LGSFFVVMVEQVSPEGSPALGAAKKVPGLLATPTAGKSWK